MTSNPVQIVSVWGGQPWFKVRDSAGETYATKSPFLASVADRYRCSGATCTIDSGSGWNYRQLRSITPVDSLEQSA